MRHGSGHGEKKVRLCVTMHTIIIAAVHLTIPRRKKIRDLVI
jgi:hypothetical protein